MITVLSRLPLARYVQSAVQQTSLTSVECPRNVSMGFQFSAISSSLNTSYYSQTNTSLSSAADAKYCELGAHRTQLTLPSCWVKVHNSSSSESLLSIHSIDQIRIVLSMLEAVKILLPAGSQSIVLIGKSCPWNIQFGLTNHIRQFYYKKYNRVY